MTKQVIILSLVDWLRYIVFPRPGYESLDPVIGSTQSGQLQNEPKQSETMETTSDRCKLTKAHCTEEKSKEVA